MLDILSYPESIIGPTMIGRGVKLSQSKGSQMAGKRYFEIEFCKNSTTY